MATISASQKENRPQGPVLSCGELKMMLGQCLKMASENKITASNTWGLPLIEHLDDLIKEEDPTQHMNFQRASVTLDAGVKIYSYRVDSVHTETFKILGGLGRASGPVEDQEGDQLGDGGVGENASPSKRKRRNHELNPDATLESSYDALNVKKFDLAFAVDPLFHKTSAQFDEGGAKGLLLNNLSVYRGCEIVFDSMDVPEDAVDDDASHTHSINAAAVSCATVDLDSVRPQFDAVLGHVYDNNTTTTATGEKHHHHRRLSPTLDDILSLLGAAPGEEAAAEADAFVRSVAEGAPLVVVVATTSPLISSSGAGDGEDEMMMMEADGDSTAGAVYGENGNDVDDFDGGGYDYDDDTVGGGGENGTFAEHHHNQQQQQQQQRINNGEASASLQEDAISWLIAAGTSSGQSSSASSSSYITASKGWAGASHWRYRAVTQNKHTGGDQDQDDNEEEDEEGGGDAYGGECDSSAFADISLGGGDDDNLEVAQASHKVEKVHVNYSRAAKQVDVRSLKELMWNGIQAVLAQRGGISTEDNDGDDDVIEFSDILASVPAMNGAGRLEDLSIHLCFICVLHLANEHGLAVKGVPELNRMLISNVPTSAAA